MTRRAIIAIALALGVQCGSRGPSNEGPASSAEPAVWAADRNDPGPDEPPFGVSLFDALFSTLVDGKRVYGVPFPFQALTSEIAKLVRSGEDVYLRQVLIPIGRSLQSTRNRPDYFASPRIVVGVDGESADDRSGLFLKDRLYLGYQPRGEIIEVISYNELAGRFEFQVVHDYAEGKKPRVERAGRKICGACHQGLAPIFPRALWNETNANDDIAELLSERAPDFFGVRARGGVDPPSFLDEATDRAGLFAAYQLIWSQGCPDAPCRADALLAALAYRLGDPSGAAEPERRRLAEALAAAWRARWRGGLLIPSPDIPDRDVMGNLRRESERAGRPELITRAGTLEFAAFVESSFAAPVFNPATTREPIQTWLPQDITVDFTREMVVGLAGFFSQADIRRIREAVRGGDSNRLRDAIEELAQAGSDGLSEKPLRRTVVVSELLAKLSK
jgi:hypothetical protein